MSHTCENYLKQFDPFRDSNGWVSEKADDYAARMQAELLPRWPKEVLIEWLHRHNIHADRYAFLGFENLSFRPEVRPLNEVPGREAFDAPGFYDDFVNVDLRAENPNDYLAQYMVEHGTWNTPVVLLENPDTLIKFPDGCPMKSPFHLLEGHRRLSFLDGLRQNGKAKPEHHVWIATWNGHYATFVRQILHC